MDMRIGEKTHHLLSDYLNALKKWPLTADDIQTFKDRIVTEMETEFAESKSRDYTSYDKDRKFGLSEHYYGENVDDKLPEAIQKVIANLDVFLQSERHEKVQYYFNTAKMVYVERPREKDFESMKVNLSAYPELKNLNVMASPDFGVIFSDNNYLIIDWKSWQEKMESDVTSDQLKIYALKTITKSKISLDTITIEWYEVYLPSLHQIGGKIDATDINHIVQKLKDDMEYQRQFLVDGDILKNEPLSHDHFPRTNSAKKCATCTFRKVCEDLKSFE